jgi:hypothetical protein
MIKSRCLEIGSLKLNVAKNQKSGPKPKVTFDMLFDKYSKQKAVTSDRPLKNDEITYTPRRIVFTSKSCYKVQGLIIIIRTSLCSTLGTF